MNPNLRFARGVCTPPLDRAEFTEHDGFKLLFVNVQIAGKHFRVYGTVIIRFGRHGVARARSACKVQPGINMHIVPNVIPFNNDSCAVGAENGIGSIFKVTLRVIGELRDYAFGISALPVVREFTAEPPSAACVCRKLTRVAAHGGDGRSAAECAAFAVVAFFGRGKTAAHAANVVYCSAEVFTREFKSERVEGLQQDALRAHQSLPYGAIGCLSEIAPFGMVKARPPRNEGQLHIRYR